MRRASKPIRAWSGSDTMFTRSPALLLLISFGAVVRADEPPATPAMPASRAVKEGNQFLKGGNPSAALERYKDAKAAEPDAREIAFDEGLAHHALGEYDKARAAFDRAAGGEQDALADNAIYSAGATDHTEALAQSADPKAAMSKLENAMQQYQTVLSRRPQHEAARDANYKAASYWRQLKQIQEQQQQQQPNQSGEKNEDEQSEQEKQEQSAEQDQQQQEQQQQSASQEPQEKSQDQQQAQEQQSEETQQEESQTAKAEEKEDVSREQAERQLREMMQAQRDRKKQRREEVRKAPLQPVEKDW